MGHVVGMFLAPLLDFGPRCLFLAPLLDFGPHAALSECFCKCRCWNRSRTHNFGFRSRTINTKGKTFALFLYKKIERLPLSSLIDGSGVGSLGACRREVDSYISLPDLYMGGFQPGGDALKPLRRLTNCGHPTICILFPKENLNSELKIMNFGDTDISRQEISPKEVKSAIECSAHSWRVGLYSSQGTMSHRKNNNSTKESR